MNAPQSPPTRIIPAVAQHQASLPPSERDPYLHPAARFVTEYVDPITAADTQAEVNHRLIMALYALDGVAIAHPDWDLTGLMRLAVDGHRERGRAVRLAAVAAMTADLPVRSAS